MNSCLQVTVQTEKTNIMTNINNSTSTKQYHFTSEFGLYRYHDCDKFKLGKSHNRFGFVVVLLTGTILLLLACAILYNYVSRTKSILVQSLYKLNNTEADMQNSTDANARRILYSNQDIEYNSNQSGKESVLHENEVIHLRKLKYAALNTIMNQKNSDSKEPRPFLYEIRDPVPTAFKPNIATNHKYTQDQVNNQISKVKNIQDIIKYLTEQRHTSELSSIQFDNSKTIKISGTYKQPDIIKENQRLNNHNMNNNQIADPFFPYKPQNPSDVNLLAVDNFRFAPSVQVEPKKPHYIDPSSIFDHSKFRKTKSNKPNDMAVTYNVVPINVKQKRKNVNGLYAPYYRNQNYFNNMVRYPYEPYKQQHFRNKNKIEITEKEPSKMIIHLNLYPRGKSKDEKTGIEIEEIYKTQSNCTLAYENSRITQIPNAAEFNNLLQSVRHYGNDGERQDKSIDIPCENTTQNIHNHTRIPEEVEIVKSIGFTILNPINPQTKVMFPFNG